MPSRAGSSGKLGIIAGRGALPHILVQACRRAARPYYLVALEGHADDPALRNDDPHWFRLGAAGSMIDILRREQVGELVFAGGVHRPGLAQWMPDWRTTKFILGRAVWRRRDGSLLNAMVETLEKDDGFAVVAPESVVPDLLAQEGSVGAAKADMQALRDIGVGFQAARQLGRQDLGQGVVVRDGVVVGREDRTGTDALLARCRNPASGRRGVLVKVAKPKQDRRVDLPAIGLRTVEGAAAAGLAGIAVEAGAALIVDRDSVARAADAAGLFVVGVKQ